MVTTLLLMASASAAEVDLIVGSPQGPWRRLFLDDTHIAEQHGLRRVFHRAQKHPGNPVVAKTQPWEGFGPYVHGTVMRGQDGLRMWYFIYTRHYLNGYAESSDGLAWTKPKLGLCPYRGARDTNLVLSDEKSVALALNLSVIGRPWLSEAGERYIAFFNSLAAKPIRPRFATSPDGIHWTIDPTPLKGLRSGDEMRVCYDPYRRQYVATCKTAKLRRGRAVSLALSPDGLTWHYVNGAKPVVYSLETGKQANQIYDMPVFPYQGLYIGLPNVYHAGWPDHVPPMQPGELGEAEKGTPTTLEIEVAWSRDLEEWHRPANAGHGPLIALGEPGAFDCGCIMGVANAPIVMGGELWFYYGGWTGPHRSHTRNAAIGLATLRLDGFASMEAGDREGWLVTPAERLTRPAVTINAKVQPGGGIWAELVDAEGHVAPGFEREQCSSFDGDSVEHLLTWQGRSMKPWRPARELKVRFYLRKAALFAYSPG